MRLMRALVVAAIVSLALASVPYPALADGGVTYVVRPGDTLAMIAAANGSTTQALIDANGLSNPDLLRAGKKLIIPRGAAAPPAAVRAAPQSASSPAGPVLRSTYDVRKGQTLGQIARELGVSPTAFVSANGLINPNWIYSGMVLLIPGAQSVTALIGPVTDTRFIASISEQRCWLYQAGKLTGNWR